MRVVRRRPAAALAATVLAMGVLSACGGEGEGGSSSSSTTATPRSVETSSSSSSTSSSSSSESSSSTKGGEGSVDLPEAATKHTQDGAVAFAKFYWHEQSRALHEGDVSTLKQLYSAQCDVCQTYVERVEGRIKEGLHADIIATSIDGAKVTKDTNGKSDQAVNITATDASYRLVDNSGESIGKTKELDYRIIIYLNWEDASWTVVDSYMIT